MIKINMDFISVGVEWHLLNDVLISRTCDSPYWQMLSPCKESTGRGQCKLHSDISNVYSIAHITTSRNHKNLE